MLYLYILGCEIAFLRMIGIESMDTVDAKFSDIIVHSFLWPLELCKAVFHAVCHCRFYRGKPA